MSDSAFLKMNGLKEDLYRVFNELLKIKNCK